MTNRLLKSQYNHLRLFLLYEFATNSLGAQMVFQLVSDTKYIVVNFYKPIDILFLYHNEVFHMNKKFTNDEWLLTFQQKMQSGLSVRKWCDGN